MTVTPADCHELKQSTWPRTDPPLWRLSWTEAVDLTQNWPTTSEAVMDWSSRPDPELTHQSGGCHGLKQSTWPRTDPPVWRLSWTEAVDLTQNWPTSLEAVGNRWHYTLNRLVVPISRLSTVGSWAFLVTSLQTWNDLLEHVTSSELLATIRRLLETLLFKKSFPDYLLDINWLSPVDLAVVPLLRPPKEVLID